MTDTQERTIPEVAGRLWRWGGMPALALVLLGGVWLHHSSYRVPDDYSDYHARSRAAVEAMPRQVGFWVGRDVPLPQPALALLDPNVLRHIRYGDFSPETVGGPPRRVSLMVVHCRAVKDMLGHYPPRCYPAQGARLVRSEPRNWEVRGLVDDREVLLRIEGMEYHFVDREPAEQREGPWRWMRSAGVVEEDAGGEWSTLSGSPRRRVVLNFMIVPGEGIVREMKGLSRVAEDYEQRHRGAAQVQVVFDTAGALPDRRERDTILAELLGASMPALATLMDMPAGYWEEQRVPEDLAEAAGPGQPGKVELEVSLAEGV